MARYGWAGSSERRSGARAGKAVTAAMRAGNPSLVVAAALPLAIEAALTRSGAKKFAEALERLGVHPADLNITGTTARFEVTWTTNIKEEDFVVIEEALRTAGVRRAVINIGPVINERLRGVLDRGRLPEALRSRGAKLTKGQEWEYEIELDIQ